VIYTRRQFLAGATAGAAALVAGGGVLGACTKDAAREPPPGTPSPPSTSERATRTTGIPTTPPTEPLARVASVAVHPAVGIARVGNSADRFFFGPELPGRLPVAPDGFKDAGGAIARQAARFRIYGYDAAGGVVGEITAAEATITWTVSVANKKAAWYDFDRAMDLPVAAPVQRRNANVSGAARDRLVVAAGAQSISGPAAHPVALDAGRFLGEPVPLGELLTDERGRLVFVPAEGRGYAPGKAPLTTFADNDGWADDTCDGPVLAAVTIGGHTMHAEPGWIVVTPPNYGPGLRAGLITAYDSSRVGWDTFDAAGLTAADVSFRDDILPILARIVDMQWVNAGFLGSHGWGSGADYLAPDLLDRLADPSPANAPLRRRTFEQFRNPDHPSERPAAAPRIYGDGVSFSARTPYQWLTVTPIQYALLRAWAAGTFTDDRDRPFPSDLATLSPHEQTLALDRAGFDACLGGAYHPGIEMPWTLRVPSMWSGAGRLRVRSATVENLDYGDELTPEHTMAADGPLAGSGPGDLTRWLGTPWHGDAASCRAGYQPEVSTVLPTFWPARIPNHVLREVDYLVVVDTTAPMADRQAAFERRFDWERFVAAADHGHTLRNMVRHWGELGLVTEQPGPTDGVFPAVMLVETNVGFGSEPTVTWNAAWQAIDPMLWDGGPVTTPS
jgi:L-Lysine epsilon oxidase N-terminal/L-lysine epsilon oxidase C-terminal domain